MTDINKIYRYQVLNECGLGFCFDDELNEGALKSFVEKQAKEKCLNMIQRAIEYFTSIGDEKTNRKFTNFVKKIWTEKVSNVAKMKMIFTFLASAILVTSVLVKIIGKEKVDGKEFKVVDNADGKTVEAYDTAEEFSEPKKEKTVKTATDFKITDNGKELIKSHEKLILKPYHATKGEKESGMVTIGYGHVIKENDPDWLKSATAITKEQALDIFNKDIENAEKGVKRIISGKLSGHQKEASFYPQSYIDVLVSLVFNAGVGGFLYSDLFQDMKKIRYDDDTEMANMSDFDVVVKKLKTTAITQNGTTLDGLKNRRNEEYHYIYNNLQ